MLMHGDDHQGDEHKAEDQYLRFKPVLRTGSPEKAGPKDAEQTFHASMMHNGEDPAHAHKVTKPQTTEKLGPQDADDAFHGVMMHGDDQTGHKHAKEDGNLHTSTTTEGQMAQPMDAEQMMHGVLMHGDAKVENHHVHENPNENQAKEAHGPVDLEDKMHALMHEDGKVHVHHEGEDEKPAEVNGPSDQEDLIHQLMHNGENLIHDILSENKPFKFNIAEIMKLGIDADILKSVGLDKMKKDDEADYQNWQKKEDTDDSLGETIAYISDSIIPDLQVMKQRYMNYGEEAEKELQNMGSKNKKISAEKLTAKGNREHDAADHVGDDMQHDLELIGSTEPINARHKAYLDRRN
jgi:hypothetical protein